MTGFSKKADATVKFVGGSFEQIQIFSKFFSTESMTESGPQIHKFGLATEDIWVRTIISCHQLSLFISPSQRQK